MSVSLPNLDDRRWKDLVEEGIALVPSSGSGWTDFNAHDPGVTLVELLSWVTEMDVFQLSRLTPAERLKLLALVGIVPQAARPARTVLAFSLAEDHEPCELPRFLEFEFEGPAAVKVRLRTLNRVYVAAAALEQIYVETAAGFLDVTRRVENRKAFAPFGADPKPAAALYLGFDQALPAKKPISLAITCGDLFASAEQRRILMSEARAQLGLCSPRLVTTCSVTGKPIVKWIERELSPETALKHHSAELIWEYYESPDRWRPLEVHRDNTRSLTLSGRVVIRGPDRMANLRIGDSQSPLFPIRCRLVSGSFDTPPSLSDVSLNATEAVEVVRPDLNPYKTRSTGWPHQRIDLPQPPVFAPSVRMTTGDAGTRYRWRMRKNLEGTPPGSREAALDAEAGTITIGDGVNGWVPPRDKMIKVRYLTMPVEPRDLPAQCSFVLPKEQHHRRLSAVAEKLCDAVSATNAIELAGAAAAETLEHAEGRAMELVERSSRAVTLTDYENLAKATPGVCISRAVAFANVHPDFPCIRAPGVITVFVLPFLPVGRPVPSDGLLKLVGSYLAGRRMIGTRIVVAAPHYREIAVHARIEASSGVDAEATRREVVVALARFFDPVVGGREGRGWPLGREVVRADLLSTIGRVPGVRQVASLEIVVDGGADQCGSICIGFGGLVASGNHQIQLA